MRAGGFLEAVGMGGLVILAIPAALAVAIVLIVAWPIHVARVCICAALGRAFPL